MPLPRLPAALILPAVSMLFAAQATAAELTVEVTGATASGGTIEVSLFDSADGFMREPFLQQSGAPGEDGRFETVFVALPEGEYAVVAVHDEDGNGVLDGGFLGIGAEGYGFSNGAWALFGWPSFERAAFRVDGDLSIEVRLD